MSRQEWSDALALELPVMDHTQRELVELLARVQAADGAVLSARWAASIDHADDHVERDDPSMQGTGFAASNHGRRAGAGCADPQPDAVPMAESA